MLYNSIASHILYEFSIYYKLLFLVFEKEFWFGRDFLDFCEGIFIKDFVIPSQGGTQGPFPCFTRGDFAANTGWGSGSNEVLCRDGLFS